jgi:transcriptional regulator with XRE-family HTH domain
VHTIEQFIARRRIEVGRNVSRARLRANLTQQDLADFLGCSRIHINRVERGQAELYVSQLELIAEKLEVPVEKLLGPDPLLTW